MGSGARGPGMDGGHVGVAAGECGVCGDGAGELLEGE